MRTRQTIYANLLNLWIAYCLILLTSHGRAADKHSVRLIAIDDFRPELACYGAKYVTPRQNQRALRLSPLPTTALQPFWHQPHDGHAARHHSHFRNRHTGVATLRYDWTPFPTPRLNLTNAADLLAAPLSLQVE